MQNLQGIVFIWRETYTYSYTYTHRNKPINKSWSSHENCNIEKVNHTQFVVEVGLFLTIILKSRFWINLCFNIGSFLR